jgi:hypothetical protein
VQLSSQARAIRIICGCGVALFKFLDFFLACSAAPDLWPAAWCGHSISLLIRNLSESILTGLLEITSLSVSKGQL